MSWWQWALIVVAFLFIAVRLAFRFNPRLRRAGKAAVPVGAMMRMRESGIDAQESIFQAISPLRHRTPWSALSDGELRYAATQLAGFANYPSAVGAIISEVELSKDVGLFKDRQRLADAIRVLQGLAEAPQASDSPQAESPRGQVSNQPDPWKPADVSPQLLRSFNRSIEVHSDFIKKNVSSPQARAAEFWFCIAPTMMFFGGLVDQRGRSQPVPLLQNAQSFDGESCAALTQGYSSFMLYQMLTNGEGFRDEMQMLPSDVEKVLSRLPSDLPFSAFRYYRERFGIALGQPNAVDPRDWSLVWLWDVASVLIPDDKVQERVFKDWDNPITRLEFVAAEMERFGSIRKSAQDYVAGRV
ncbi:hypothetical protein [Gemmatimonas groenlandica]|uniref:Uncharacterized protein n=1 Tax=Gemmatimonas groenlandica TaxID=2732249 RepID=A0A6M4IKF8_9BACT|nr:hypothetical protein [Gemmatimonas groenlandica]QJR35223.1 hypothetical protein HKW67_06750 [Gemmatimonas groenlandica]